MRWILAYLVQEVVARQYLLMKLPEVEEVQQGAQQLLKAPVVQLSLRLEPVVACWNSLEVRKHRGREEEVGADQNRLMVEVVAVDLHLQVPAAPQPPKVLMELERP